MKVIAHQKRPPQSNWFPFVLMANIVSVISAFVTLIVCLLHTSLAELNLSLPARNYINDNGHFTMEEINSTRESIRQVVAAVYDNDFDNFNKVMDYMRYSNKRRFKADVIIGLHVTMKKVQHIKNPLRSIRLAKQVTDRLNDMEHELEESQKKELENMKITLTEESIVPQGARFLSTAVIMNQCYNNDRNIDELLDYLYNEDDQDISNRVITQMVDIINCMVPRSEVVETLMNLSKHLSQTVAALVEVSKQSCNELLFPEVVEKLKDFLHGPEISTTVSLGDQVQINKLFQMEFGMLDRRYICLSKMISDGSLLYLQPCSKDSFKMCIAKKKSFLTPSFLRGYFVFKTYGGHWLNIDNDAKQFDHNFKLNLNGVTNAKSKYLWSVHVEEDRMTLCSPDKKSYACGGNRNAKKGDLWYAYTRNTSSYEKYEEECRWYFRCSL